MTPARIAQLKRVIAETPSLTELEGVRAQLTHQQELVGEVYQALSAQVDLLAKREGINPAKWWRRR